MHYCKNKAGRTSRGQTLDLGLHPNSYRRLSYYGEKKRPILHSASGLSGGKKVSKRDGGKPNISMRL